MPLLLNLLFVVPNAQIIDVTSRGEEPYIKLSPFYPHGNIPVPFSEGVFSCSVEGIWQGLKVFESEDVDRSKFEVKNMKNIKRTARKFGKPLGHRKGVNGTELLDYITARKSIYLYSYAWILDNNVQDLINSLKNIALEKDIVLLDFDTNADIEDGTKPLSHASLVKRYLDKKFPEINTVIVKKVENKELKEIEPKKQITKKKKVVRNKGEKPNSQLTIGF